MKYRLLRDCPHGKAGSVWERIDDREESGIYLQYGVTSVFFPVSTFSDWFEEIKEMKPIPKECIEPILSRLDNELPDSRYWEKARPSFKAWLDENTEK